MMMKALVGVEAVRLLRNDSRFNNDAASRLYYALYHACWAFLQSTKPPTPFDPIPFYQGQANSYSHNKLEEKLRPHQDFAAVAGERWQHLLGRALRCRRKADYASEGVEKQLVDDLAGKVEVAVNGLHELLRSSGT
ncbi:MAG: hypothetical protein JXL80_18155 [Planctomycetes bacterium]|nr:hypothetical protein [Planctomycetota bacterium]